MSQATLTQNRSVPSFKVLVGKDPLPTEAGLDLLGVRVSDYVEGAAEFLLTFNNWHSDLQQFKWIDKEIFKEGALLEVKVGFDDEDLKSLIVGEVAAIEPEFHENEAPTLKIHGYDRLHRFRRGRKTQTFVEMKDSQIAEKVARDLDLTPQVEDTGVVLEYVLQNNMTGIDFLLERARRIRYEVTVQDKTLHFRKAASGKSRFATLEYGYTLKSFYPRLSTVKQVSRVVVQGWDPLAKEPIEGRAGSGDEDTRMNGTRLGSAVSESAFFSSEAVIVDKPVFSQGEAVQIARGKFNDMAVEYITGEGHAIGNPDIRAGRVIELAKLGERFSGFYYITSSTHVIDPRGGYTTRFTVERNAT